MFTRQVEKQDRSAVFIEYAWDMRWCDPCAADPLSPDELRRLGVFWSDDARGGGAGAFLTRLHVRYDNAHFPEDLVFQETADRSNFQGALRAAPPWTGGQDRAARRATIGGRWSSVTPARPSSWRR